MFFRSNKAAFRFNGRTKFWICGKFLYKLPEWTSPDLSNEEEPPAPYETILSRQQMVTAGDTLTQSFVSPAILQANETGALILSRNFVSAFHDENGGIAL